MKSQIIHFKCTQLFFNHISIKLENKVSITEKGKFLSKFIMTLKEVKFLEDKCTCIFSPFPTLSLPLMLPISCG